MTPEERARKIRELMADHQAAGGYISREVAERIIDEVEAKMKEGGRSNGLKLKNKSVLESEYYTGHDRQNYGSITL